MRTVTVSWIHVLFCLGDTVSLESIPASDSDSISIPFPHKSLNLEVGAGFANEISLFLRAPQFSHSVLLPAVGLWISELITIYYKKKLLWWGLKVALIYENNHVIECYFIALFIFLPFLFIKHSILSRSHYYLFISFFDFRSCPFLHTY